MIFYFTGRLISSIGAFLYPGYASYKTLSQRPASEEELERWLMYWSVLGCIIGVEYVAEWLISWIPFYYTLKTLFLLYLALPQTRGSSYLYINHLQPFFHTHETQIDAALASFKAKVYAFVQERVRILWDHVASTVGQQQQAAFQPSTGAPTTGPPPSMAIRPRALRNSFLPSGDHSSVLDRKRQLEAELAALSADPIAMPEPTLIPPASPAFLASRSSSEIEMNLRERSASGSGRFEEIEVPSDVEGYDSGSGNDSGRPGNQKRGSSWFGWGGQGAAKSGDERVKND
ncbi:TB2/DP1, HVA22 family-domain-containing protein [Infundibulicybe gibba]|nr:TB2/DP1, HVA22 family-domain-containing protein [Infundibulicybe gibba]